MLRKRLGTDDLAQSRKEKNPVQNRIQRRSLISRWKPTGIEKMYTQWSRGLGLVEVREDGNQRARCMSAFQNSDLRVVQVVQAEAERNKNKPDCLLDTDATGNENHVFDSLDIYCSGRPYKAATHADIDFFAEDFFLGFP